MRLDPVAVDDVAALDAYVDLVEACSAVDAPPGAPLTRHALQCELRHGWDGEPGRAYLGVHDGRVVGTLAWFASSRDNLELAWLEAMVHPAQRRQGHGSALIAAAEELCRTEGRPLVGVEAWQTPAAEAFAKHSGYPVAQETIIRDQFLTRDPAERQRFAALRDEAAAHAGDYDLVRIAGRTPEHLLESLVAASAAINDAPLDDLEYEDEIFDVDRIRRYEDAQIAAGSRFRRVIAVHRATGEIVGHTVVSVDGEQPRYGEQHDTTVVPAHRGHRLGLWLKAEMLGWLLDEEDELAQIRTQNAGSNGPMIAVNERLGYTVAGQRLVLQRRI
jgi:GNAT superfamily N-acetyltransferase